jgi:hypothetical protein
MVSTRQEGSTPRVGGGHRSCRAPRMNKRQRQNAAWALEWKQVDHSDREERRQRALAIILPQRDAKARHHKGEKPKAATHRSLRQRVQGSPRRGRHERVPPRARARLWRRPGLCDRCRLTLARCRLSWGHARPPGCGCLTGPGHVGRHRSGPGGGAGPSRPQPCLPACAHRGMETLRGRERFGQSSHGASARGAPAAAEAGGDGRG